MNIYRGCEHQCIYCDSRSECYGIEDLRDVLVKANALEVLRRELPGKRVKGRVGTGAMSDPYTMTEAGYNLTGRALGMLAEFGWPVDLITTGIAIRTPCLVRWMRRCPGRGRPKRRWIWRDK